MNLEIINISQKLTYSNIEEVKNKICKLDQCCNASFYFEQVYYHSCLYHFICPLCKQSIFSHSINTDNVEIKKFDLCIMYFLTDNYDYLNTYILKFDYPDLDSLRKFLEDFYEKFSPLKFSSNSIGDQEAMKRDICQMIQKNWEKIFSEIKNDYLLNGLELTLDEFKKIHQVVILLKKINCYRIKDKSLDILYGLTFMNNYNVKSVKSALKNKQKKHSGLYQSPKFCNEKNDIKLFISFEEDSLIQTMISEMETLIYSCFENLELTKNLVPIKKSLLSVLKSTGLLSNNLKIIQSDNTISLTPDVRVDQIFENFPKSFRSKQRSLDWLKKTQPFENIPIKDFVISESLQNFLIQSKDIFIEYIKIFFDLEDASVTLKFTNFIWVFVKIMMEILSGHLPIQHKCEKTVGTSLLDQLATILRFSDEDDDSQSVIQALMECSILWSFSIYLSNIFVKEDSKILKELNNRLKFEGYSNDITNLFVDISYQLEESCYVILESLESSTNEKLINEFLQPELLFLDSNQYKRKLYNLDGFIQNLEHFYYRISNRLEATHSKYLYTSSVYESLKYLVQIFTLHRPLTEDENKIYITDVWILLKYCELAIYRVSDKVSDIYNANSVESSSSKSGCLQTLALCLSQIIISRGCPTDSLFKIHSNGFYSAVDLKKFANSSYNWLFIVSDMNRIEKPRLRDSILRMKIFENSHHINSSLMIEILIDKDCEVTKKLLLQLFSSKEDGRGILIDLLKLCEKLPITFEDVSKFLCNNLYNNNMLDTLNSYECCENKIENEIPSWLILFDENITKIREKVFKKIEELSRHYLPCFIDQGNVLNFKTYNDLIRKVYEFEIDQVQRITNQLKNKVEIVPFQSFLQIINQDISQVFTEHSRPEVVHFWTTGRDILASLIIECHEIYRLMFARLDLLQADKDGEYIPALVKYFFMTIMNIIRAKLSSTHEQAMLVILMTLQGIVERICHYCRDNRTNSPFGDVINKIKSIFIETKFIIGNTDDILANDFISKMIITMNQFHETDISEVIVRLYRVLRKNMDWLTTAKLNENVFVNISKPTEDVNSKRAEQLETEIIRNIISSKKEMLIRPKMLKFDFNPPEVKIDIDERIKIWTRELEKMDWQESQQYNIGLTRGYLIESINSRIDIKPSDRLRLVSILQES